MCTVVENKSLRAINAESTKDNNVELFYPKDDADSVVISGLLTSAIHSLYATKEVMDAYMSGEIVCEESSEKNTYRIAELAVEHLNKAAFYLSSLMGSELLKTMYYGKEVETVLTEEEYRKRFGTPEDHTQDI